jgi:plastocyanin
MTTGDFRERSADVDLRSDSSRSPVSRRRSRRRTFRAYPGTKRGEERIMKRVVSGFLAGVAVLLAVVGLAVADAKVVVTREENKPATVEIKAGEAVTWTSATGGTAHISFAGNEGLQFFVGGKEGGRVRFEKPGTYEYSVHVSGVRLHVHRGTIVVK